MTKRMQLRSNNLPTKYSHKYFTQTQNLGEFINRVRELKQLASNFQKDIQGIRSDDQVTNTILGMIGKKLIEDWSRPIKKYAKMAGGAYLKDSNLNREESIEYEVSTLIEMCSLLINDDFIKKNIPKRTKNSWKTAIRNIKKKVRPETRLKHIRYLLDRLESETKDLIVEIDVSREPIADTIIQSFKEQYPRIYQMLTKAEECKNKANTEEEYCHCLQSCRRAVEAIVIEKTKTKTFNQGKKLIDDKHRKPLETVYSYLSRYGAHVNEITTKDDMNSGFQLTLTAISQFKDSKINT